MQFGFGLAVGRVVATFAAEEANACVGLTVDFLHRGNWCFAFSAFTFRVKAPGLAKISRATTPFAFKFPFVFAFSFAPGAKIASVGICGVARAHGYRVVFVRVGGDANWVCAVVPRLDLRCFVGQKCALPFGRFLSVLGPFGGIG